MNQSKRYLFLLMAALVLALSAWSGEATARNRDSVTLVSFGLTNKAEGVELRWETATEDMVAFEVHRATRSDGPFVFLSGIGRIMARGDAVSGDVYVALDEDVVEGQSYWYQLMEVTNDQALYPVSSVRATTYSSTPGGQAIGGGDPPATATVAPTSTRSAASTPQPNNQPTTGATQQPTGQAATPTESSAASQPTATPRIVNTPGPTPTRFSFTPEPGAVLPSPPAPDSSVENEIGVAEAAGATPIAQVSTAAYPESGEAQPTPIPSDPSAVGAPRDAAPSYPAPGSFESVGSNTTGGSNRIVEEESQVAPESSSLSRILLWLGFIAALFIFVGGIAFAIALSTRRRQDDLS